MFVALSGPLVPTGVYIPESAARGDGGALLRGPLQGKRGESPRGREMVPA